MSSQSTYVFIKRHLNMKRKNPATITTHVIMVNMVNMERIDQQHLCECGLPVRGPPVSVGP